MNETFHAELSEIIINLERIHQFLPDDLSTLHLLCEAQLRAGDLEQQGDYLMRLAEQAIEQESPAMAAYTKDQIDTPSLSHRDFNHLSENLTAVAGNYTEQHATPQAASRADLYAEICLAYKLMQANEIDQREYASIASELTSLAAKGSKNSITVQHALRHRNETEMNNVLSAMVLDSRLPLISLDKFELDEEALTALPPDFMAERGAIVFERMGNNAMVAVLNPYDEGLQLDVKEKLKSPCHFFLIRATEFDELLSEKAPSTPSTDDATPL